MALRVVTCLVGTLISFGAFAQSQPPYCDPKTFSEFEQSVQVDGTERLHIFQIGHLTLAGVAVGKAEPVTLERMASEFSGVTSAAKSCTWYFNKQNDSAKAAFNFRYVPRPYTSSESNELADKYVEALGSSFAHDTVSMVGCAEKFGYIAMGCDGMRHRGPSAFAMLLAYSGCSPENSSAIANQIWGLNGVPANARLEIVKRGYELGKKNPHARARLQKIMLSETK